MVAQHLAKLIMQDPVYSIRDAATKNLQRLAQEFGPDWAKDHIVPQVTKFTGSLVISPASECLL